MRFSLKRILSDDIKSNYAKILVVLIIFSLSIAAIPLVGASDESSQTDIVLVIDTSGSMNDDGRMARARESAVNFVEKVLGDEGNNRTRVAIINFDYDAKIRTNFTKNETELVNSINSLSAYGATHTQAGIHKARLMLENSSAKNKYMIVLSDGKPTYSYAIKNPDDYLVEPDDEDILETSKEIKERDFLYNKTVGTGSDLRQSYGRNDEGVTKYYNNGNSAIAEANFAKDVSIVIYTIGIFEDDEDNEIIKEIASRNKNYKVEDVEELEDTYSEIADKIIEEDEGSLIWKILNIIIEIIKRILSAILG